MASSTRLTSPFTSPGRDVPTDPDASLRNRRPSTPQPGSPRPAENASPPSSATASTSGNISRALDSRPSLRLSALQSAQNMQLMNIGTPVRKLVVRSDPSIVTCFDPADKELYELWAPKR
ncbi:hypothetical protein BC835DRAFT_1412643 [Cytidiella melzeri]|nr:hypothetical protein BC835DRAFT_1412643 [Cytidiella melzeri]